MCAVHGQGWQLTGLFMNLRVISRASGGRVAEKTPTCGEWRARHTRVTVNWRWPH